MNEPRTQATPATVLVAQLEALWQSGQRPDPDALLATAGASSPAVVAAVLAADQWQRWHAGERPAAEDYLARHPAVAADEAAALALVYGEFLVREECGESPAPADYLARFPRYADALRRQLDFHAAIDHGAPTWPGPAVTAGGGAGPSPPPRPVSGYELLEKLGEGGMGVVYKARQLSLRRIVALKMLGGPAVTEDTVARFRVEGEAAARLQHPNIVAVYEVGSDPERPFLAMEYVDGRTLANRLSGAALPPREAARLLETLSRAVAYAHARGVIHRDLTPGNVLLDRDGTPKIADFGLAKLLAGGPALTQTEVIMGTPGYMSPEQAAGGARHVGPAADVYALGAILYECLTGRPPFKAATPLETLAQIITLEPVSPRRLLPAVPRDLDTICLKCLEKEPQRRYAGAAELADDLGRWQRGEPISVRPLRLLGRGWRWCRRRPAVASLTAAVLLLAATLMGLMFVRNVELRDSLAESDAARRRADAELWKSYAAEARAVRHSGRAGQRLAGLAAVRKALALPVPPGHSLAELRTEAAACLCLPDLEVLRAWPGVPAGTRSIAFSGSLDTYARASAGGEVSVRRVADDSEVAHFRTERDPVLRLSPDGRFVLLEPPANADTLELWRVGPGVAERRLVVPSATMQYTAFSPDGRLLAYEHAPRLLAVHDLATGKTLAEWTQPGPHMGWSLAFSHDGRRLAAGSEAGGKGVIEVRETATGKALTRLQLPTWSAGILWHPDGKRLLVTGGDGRVHVWDVAAGKELRSWESTKGSYSSFVGIDRDGTRVATADWSEWVRVWDVETGEEVFATGLSFASMDTFLLVPDREEGLRLACRDGLDGLRLVRLGGAVPHRKLAASLPAGRRPPPDPLLPLGADGRLVVALEGAVESGGHLAVLDADSGRRLATLPTASRLSPHLLAVDAAGGLLTNEIRGFGLIRWPVREEAATGAWHFGPPQRRFWKKGRDTWGASADARTFAVPTGGGATVLSLDRPARQVKLGPQGDVRHCAVSPDGRLAATLSHFVRTGQSGCNVWSTEDGTLIKELPVRGIVWSARFSPDGRWLGVSSSGAGTRLWRVGTREEGPLLSAGEHGFAFSPDGHTVAVGDQVGAVRLCATDTGAELARLEIPDQVQLHPAAFSRDGGRLFAVGSPDGGIHVWDLRALRRRLAQLGLDWDAPLPAAGGAHRPPFAVHVDRGALGILRDPPQAEAPLARAVRFTVLLTADPDDAEAYHQRGHAYDALGKHARAVDDFTEALKRQPDDAHLLTARAGARAILKQYAAAAADLERSLELKKDQADACALLAGIRARGPLELRDAKRAVALAERAVALAPKRAAYRATLGIALFRNGRPADAVPHLEAALKGPKGATTAFSLFYLAMCHHTLGDAGLARTRFQEGVRYAALHKWLDPAQGESLQATQAEAAKLLGVAAK